MNLPDTLRAGKSALVLCESDYEAGVEAQKLHTYLRESTILPHRSRVEYQGAIAQFVTVRQPDGRRPSEFDAVFSTFTLSKPGIRVLTTETLPQALRDLQQRGCVGPAKGPGA